MASAVVGIIAHIAMTYMHHTTHTAGENNKLENDLFIKALKDWSELSFPETFPYSTTLREVRKRGKHFMGDSALDALKQARSVVAAKRYRCECGRFLAKFLDLALDKVDRKYDYQTYIALPLFEQGRPDISDQTQIQRAQHAHDVTLCSIVADILQFELNLTHGRSSYLTDMLPDADLVERRIQFALRSIEAPLSRLGVDALIPGKPLHELAEEVIDFSRSQVLSHSPLVLQASMMPVYVVHDEHLFIRILQALEFTFSSSADMLRGAIAAFDAAPDQVARFLEAANGMLQEGLRHFHTLSTMQKESFSTFREFTTGASAIQSVNYKTVESLCRNPDPDRLESLAYSSVPPLQKELRSGRVSLDDKFRQIRSTVPRDSKLIPAIESAMLSLAGVLTRFKHSHYGIAKKYLGAGSGTGYSEGTPYLKFVKDIPVFVSI